MSLNNLVKKLFLGLTTAAALSVNSVNCAPPEKTDIPIQNRNTNPPIYSDAAKNDMANEPNNNFDTATKINCNEKIKATIAGINDIDFYVLNLNRPTKITVKGVIPEYKPSHLLASLYDANHNYLDNYEYEDWKWRKSAVYLSIETEIDSPYNYMDYETEIDCQVCDKDLPVYSKCVGDKLWAFSACDEQIKTIDAPYGHLGCINSAVWSFDKCGKPMQLEKTCASDESCSDGACCRDVDYYSCNCCYANGWAVVTSNDCIDHGNWRIYQDCGRGGQCDAGNSSMYPGKCF